MAYYVGQSGGFSFTMYGPSDAAWPTLNIGEPDIEYADQADYTIPKRKRPVTRPVKKADPAALDVEPEHQMGKRKITLT